MDTATSTGDLSNRFSFKVQPNLFSDRTNLNFVLAQEDEIYIKVLDVLGRVVRTELHSLTSGIQMLLIIS